MKHKINQAFQLKLSRGKVRDYNGISHMGHWVRQSNFCKTAYIKGNHMNMSRQELIEYCLNNAKSIAKDILKKE